MSDKEFDKEAVDMSGVSEEEAAAVEKAFENKKTEYDQISEEAVDDSGMTEEQTEAFAEAYEESKKDKK
ncbi:hypothetical protein [Enterococcus sp. AZ109]|uniref:hypothetical protein n=1 Tax=Enterococcus sp. AZ109 TaxID=2774634 RepID=UPI003F26A682